MKSKDLAMTCKCGKYAYTSKMDSSGSITYYCVDCFQEARSK